MNGFLSAWFQEFCTQSWGLLRDREPNTSVVFRCCHFKQLSNNPERENEPPIYPAGPADWWPQFCQSQHPPNMASGLLQRCCIGHCPREAVTGGGRGLERKPSPIPASSVALVCSPEDTPALMVGDLSLAAG